MHLNQNIISNKDIALAQVADESLSQLKVYLEKSSGQVPQLYRRYLPKLSVVGEVIVFKRNRKSAPCLLAPESLHQDILKLAHSDWASGHFGMFKSHRRVLDRFWWPTLKNDVEEFVKNCSVCAKTKSQNRTHGQLGRQPVPEKPLDIVSIDFLVDLPITSKKNIHLMVIIDWFSRYIQLHALRDRTAPSAARCIHDFSLRFGIPATILSDQDPAFESEIFNDLMRLFGIDKRRTTAYNPKSNGRCEQVNRSVKEYLTTIIEEKGLVRNSWDKWTLEMCFAYNTSVHTSTKFTPAELMFGRKFKVPMDIIYGSFQSNHKNIGFKRFSENLQKMHQLAKKNMSKTDELYRNRYNAKVIDSKLSIGDKVYYYLQKMKGSKLSTKWSGPHSIIAETHPTYKIEIETPSGKIIRTVTRDKLKLISSDTQPSTPDLARADEQLQPKNDNLIDNTIAHQVNQDDDDDDSHIFHGNDNDEEYPQEEEGFVRGGRLRDIVRPPDRYFSYVCKVLKQFL